MWADPHRFEGNTLGKKNINQQLLQRLKFFFTKTRGAETVLISDHDKGPAGVAQAKQGWDCLGLERKFFEAVNLLIKRFSDQGAITVDE